MKTIKALLVVSILCCAALAQVTPGAPSFSAYDSHEIDTVDLMNNNVSLSVPLYSKSGAFPVRYSLTLNSYVYRNGSTWTPSRDATSAVNNFLSYDNPTMAYPTVATQPVNCPGGGSTTKYSGWIIQSADKTVHPLPPSDYTLLPPCASTLTDTTIDGSGLTLSATVLATNSIYTSNGTSLLGGLTDSNGNAISLSLRTGVLTDTLGVTAVTVSGVTPISTFTWADVNEGTPQVVETNSSVYLQTNFATGCGTGTDTNTSSISLLSGLTYPDSTSVGITYETTPSHSPHVTGRLYQLTLREGGTVKYTYSGGTNGLDCTYQTVPTLSRQTSDGTTTYALTHNLISGSNYNAVNTVTDQGGNATVYTFTGFTSTGNSSAYAQVLTEVQHYLGSVSPGNLLTTDIYCYNLSFTYCNLNLSSVPAIQTSLPITGIIVFHQIHGMSNWSSQETHLDAYGNVTYSAQHDFGGSAPVRATTVTYGTWNGSSCASVATNINNKPCEVSTVYGSNTIADARYTYDSSGNLTKTSVWNGSSWIGQSSLNTYYTSGGSGQANGTPIKTFDMANNETDYSYASANYTGSPSYLPFPTTIKKCLNYACSNYLSTSAHYNSTGGVKTEDDDANGNATTYCYTSGSGCSGGTADPFWRVITVTDPLGNVASNTYNGTSDLFTSQMTFNSSNSVAGSAATTDGYGRPVSRQRQQAPSSSNYDTVTSVYGWSGNYRTVATSQPCPTTLSGSCTTVHTNYFDPLGQLYKETTTSNETIQHTFTQNDDLAVLSPPPTNENNKQTQTQYDGLGRVQFVCHVGSTTSTGSGTACNQNTGSASGATDAYVYSSPSAGQIEIQVTRGGSGGQVHTAYYDALNRLIKKTTPEGGTWQYFYDGYSSCPSGWGVNGQLSATKDPNNNLICYKYDALNRTIAVNANSTTCRAFYFDSTYGTVPSGVTSPTYTQGRLADAQSTNCSGTLLTDEWFSYDKDGRQADIWQSTPNSGQYYHSKATFYSNGVPDTVQLASPNLYTSTYSLDGEGRPNALTVYGQTIVPSNGVTYNAAGQTLNVAIGSSTDSDAYTYDSNTGVMTGWTFTVGTHNETGVLQWNANRSLGYLAITDGFHSGGTQTCYFTPASGTTMGYDDWGRLLSDVCGTGGSIWNQTFSYDIYDNLAKSSNGPGISWNPGYSATTNHYTLSGTSYDSNGNLTNDSFHAYTWNEFSRMKSIDMSGTNCATSGQCLVYDAFNRLVEVDSGSTYTEIWYTQVGKTAYMNGSTYKYAYWPTPGGGTLLQVPGSYYFQHKDWLGNARISSTLGTTVIDDRAFAPYGEMYDNFGSTQQNELIFTGDTQDAVAGIYNTPNRELHGAAQGRWLSPDPVGASWNAYAYVTNPNHQTDPTGLYCYVGEGCNWGMGMGTPGFSQDTTFYSSVGGLSSGGNGWNVAWGQEFGSFAGSVGADSGTTTFDQFMNWIDSAGDSSQGALGSSQSQDLLESPSAATEPTYGTACSGTLIPCDVTLQGGGDLNQDGTAYVWTEVLKDTYGNPIAGATMGETILDNPSAITGTMTTADGSNGSLPGSFTDGFGPAVVPNWDGGIVNTQLVTATSNNTVYTLQVNWINIGWKNGTVSYGFPFIP